MVKRLLDKVIVITGGTSGIGLEIARHSISQGAYVVISGRRENEGKRIVTELGEKCHFMECDVLYEDQIRKLVEETFSKHGRIDVMFNNAGAPDFIRNIEDISYDKIKHSLDLLLTSVIIGTREVTKIMSKQKYGSIINTASIAGHWGGCGGSVYSAAKAGMIGLTKSLAREFAARSVTVNAIAPGFIDTDMTSELDERVKEGALATIPLKRFGEVSDIAEMAAFLCSDRASYVTGQVFTVDGGMVM